MIFFILTTISCSNKSISMQKDTNLSLSEQETDLNNEATKDIDKQRKIEAALLKEKLEQSAISNYGVLCEVLEKGGDELIELCLDKLDASTILSHSHGNNIELLKTLLEVREDAFALMWPKLISKAPDLEKRFYEYLYRILNNRKEIKEVDLKDRDLNSLVKFCKKKKAWEVIIRGALVNDNLNIAPPFIYTHGTSYHVISIENKNNRNEYRMLLDPHERGYPHLLLWEVTACILPSLLLEMLDHIYNYAVKLESSSPVSHAYRQDSVELKYMHVLQIVPNAFWSFREPILTTLLRMAYEEKSNEKLDVVKKILERYRGMLRLDFIPKDQGLSYTTQSFIEVAFHTFGLGKGDWSVFDKAVEVIKWQIDSLKAKDSAENDDYDKELGLYGKLADDTIKFPPFTYDVKGKQVDITEKIVKDSNTKALEKIAKVYLAKEPDALITALAVGLKAVDDLDSKIASELKNLFWTDKVAEYLRMEHNSSIKDIYEEVKDF